MFGLLFFCEWKEVVRLRKQAGNVRYLVQASLIAAVYTALCMLLQPISFGFGGVELRVSETLTLLPILTPAAIPGLFVGCLLSNVLGGATLLDVTLGSLTTLTAALLTRKLRRWPIAAAVPPVMLNAVVVGALLKYAYGVALPLYVCMLSIGVGQLLACCALGFPLLRIMKKIPGKHFRF